VQCLPKKDKQSLLAMLQNYWLLKRRSRNGLPLLRRLQVAIPPAVATKVCLSPFVMFSEQVYWLSLIDTKCQVFLCDVFGMKRW